MNHTTCGEGVTYGTYGSCSEVKPITNEARKVHCSALLFRTPVHVWALGHKTN